MKKRGIYILTNTVNGKQYIGQSVDLVNRSRRHFYPNNTCSAIHSAIQKYGKDAFDVELIEYPGISKDALNAIETWKIHQHQTLAPNGYNLNCGGDSRSPSSETRRKLSEFNKGKKLTSETRRKMSASRKGRKVDIQTRQKIAKANTGKTPSKVTRQKISETLKGRSLPIEHRQNISKGQKGRIFSPETRKKIGKANKGRHKGKSPTAETRRKMSIAQKERRRKEKECLV